jgi:hypothetical protein
LARRKAERPAERGARRAETNAVAAYLTALQAPKVPARSRDAREKRRAQIEQWIAEERSPMREVELIQQRLDIDAQPAQIDQAARLPELEQAFVNVAASWAKRTGISAAALREVGVPASVLKRAGAGRAGIIVSAIAMVLGVIGVVIVSDAFDDLDDDLTCLDEADTRAEIDACNH